MAPWENKIKEKSEGNGIPNTAVADLLQRAAKSSDSDGDVANLLQQRLDNLRGNVKVEHQIKNNITKTDEIPYVHPPDPSTSSTMPAQIQDAMQNDDVMSRIIQARDDALHRHRQRRQDESNLQNFYHQGVIRPVAQYRRENPPSQSKEDHEHTQQRRKYKAENHQQRNKHRTARQKQVLRLCR